jgi:hypothetical protein
MQKRRPPPWTYAGSAPPAELVGDAAPAGEKRPARLPGNQPKSTEDDPLAHERVQAILRGPGYRLAEQDVDFLARADERGVRLQLDYAKAQLQLERYEVAHTIVVFGSTRIPEPAAAHRALRLLREQARGEAGAQAAGTRNGDREIEIAERIVAKSRYYNVARELGRLISESSAAARRFAPAAHIVVMTGGGPGIMEAANRGAFDAGAPSVGLNIDLPHEQYPNPYVTPELCLRFHYFALRKLHFLLRARALVAFPGGYGTFDELFETLTLVQTRKIDPLPVVLVGRDYWRRAFDVDFLVDEGVIADEDRELFWYAESAEAIWGGILDWYRRQGRPLVPEGAQDHAAAPPDGP